MRGLRTNGPVFGVLRGSSFFGEIEGPEGSVSVEAFLKVVLTGVLFDGETGARSAASWFRED